MDSTVATTRRLPRVRLHSTPLPAGWAPDLHPPAGVWSAFYCWRETNTADPVCLRLHVLPSGRIVRPETHGYELGLTAEQQTWASIAEAQWLAWYQHECRVVAQGAA